MKLPPITTILPSSPGSAACRVAGNRKTRRAHFDELRLTAAGGVRRVDDRTQPDHAGLPRDAVDHALAHVVAFDPDRAIDRQGVERPLAPAAVGALTIGGREGGEASGHPLERRILVRLRRAINRLPRDHRGGEMHGRHDDRRVAVARLGKELPAPHFAVAVALE